MRRAAPVGMNGRVRDGFVMHDFQKPIARRERSRQADKEGGREMIKGGEGWERIRRRGRERKKR